MPALRKRQPDFTEKLFGYAGFLQFCTAARARGFVDMEWDEEADDYLIEASGNVAEPPAQTPAPAKAPKADSAPRSSTRTPRRRSAPRP